MATLNTWNKKAVRPAKAASKAKAGAYDWETFTGKLGTVTGKFVPTASGAKVKLFASSNGSGSAYISVYLPAVDDRLSLFASGLSIKAADGEIREQSNGKFKVVVDLLPSPANAEDGARVEPLTIGGFLTREQAEQFESVTIKAS